MNRAEKAAEVEKLKSRFVTAQLMILADYKGLSVASITDLRSKLREKQSSLKVVKNRLAKIAIKDTPVDVLNDHFVGATAIATTEIDPTGPAKVLTDFAKDNESLKIKIGFMDGKALDLNAIKTLASLPSKEELIVKLLGSMQAPATNLVNVLSQIPRQLVNVLSAIKEQKETQS